MQPGQEVSEIKLFKTFYPSDRWPKLLNDHDLSHSKVLTDCIFHITEHNANK